MDEQVGGPLPLTRWDAFSSMARLNVGEDIEPAQVEQLVSPAGSLYMPATRVSDDHGLLVNLDSVSSLLRVWDLETGETHTFAGFGANHLAQNGAFVWVTSERAGRLARVDPLGRNQIIWPLTDISTGVAVNPITGHPFVVGQLGKVTHIDPSADFRVVWDLPVASDSVGIDIDREGLIWLADSVHNLILRFNPERATCNLVAWVLPGCGHPIRPHVDALGAVWFADPAARVVGRLNPGNSTVSYYFRNDIQPVDAVGLVDPNQDSAAFADASGSIGIASGAAGAVSTPVIDGVAVLNTVETKLVGRAQSRPDFMMSTIESQEFMVNPVGVPPVVTYPVSGGVPSAVTQSGQDIFAAARRFIYALRFSMQPA